MPLRMRDIPRILCRTWFTGVLWLLAFFGYCFYLAVWLFRGVQLYMKTVMAIPVAVLLAAGAVVVLTVPFAPRGGKITLTVEQGTALGAIARRLREKEVIPSAPALVAWIKLNGNEKKVQAGRYSFFVNEGMFSAARKLLEATPIQLSTTIPEGLTIEQTAGIVSRDLPVDSAAFAAACYDSSHVHALDIPASSLEGYLFPDSYLFAEDVGADEVIRRMTARFAEVWDGLPAKSPAVESLSMHEIVTLASIVEKEATVAHERPRIAGVFANRLEKGYPLGADPTVRYALRKFSGPLRVSELNNRSPYNTRVHAGLPPGPICSPGEASLRASVAPLETDELYFVAKWDGSGEHDFSLTNAEHERKKRRIRRDNRRRKRELQRARESSP